MKKIFLMLVAAFMVGAATMNAQVKGGEFILRGGFAANNFTATARKILRTSKRETSSLQPIPTTA